jgi:hypothetical protein
VSSTMPTTGHKPASQPMHPLPPSSVRVLVYSLAARRTGTTSEPPGSSISSDGNDERAAGQLRERRNTAAGSRRHMIRMIIGAPPAHCQSPSRVERRYAHQLSASARPKLAAERHNMSHETREVWRTTVGGFWPSGRATGCTYNPAVAGAFPATSPTLGNPIGRAITSARAARYGRDCASCGWVA